MASGLIVQFGISPKGTYTGGKYDIRKITFPKSFPNMAFFGFGSDISANDRGDYFTGYLSTSRGGQGTGTPITNSYMCMSAWNVDDYRWLAVGY